MEQIWEKLYNEALRVINPHEVSNALWVGSVASAILTKRGNIYTGICIDTNSSLGMCAERNALSTMLTHGESEVDKVVSVYKDGKVIPSCGACREFMMHLGNEAGNIEILLDNEGRSIKLIIINTHFSTYTTQRLLPCILHVPF
jgi:cytidine deaminase